MFKQLLILLGFLSGTLFPSYRPSRQHIKKQDSYEYSDDIKILALEHNKVAGISIPELELDTIIADAIVFAMQRNAIDQDDDGMMLYSRQTVFNYIYKALKRYEQAPDTRMEGDAKNILQLPCLHTFHEPCILRWADGEPAVKCPICRTRYNTNQLQLCSLPSPSDAQTADDSDKIPQCGVCLEYFEQPARCYVSLKALMRSPSKREQKRPRQKPLGINHPKQVKDLRQRPVWRP